MRLSAILTGLALAGVSLVSAPAAHAAPVESCVDPAGYGSEEINADLQIVVAPATLSTMASGACSNHGYLLGMTYRFDWDGDGKWDDQNEVGVSSHRFAEPGAYRVTLEVEDEFGRVARTVGTASVPAISDIGNAMPAEEGAQPLEGAGLSQVAISRGGEVELFAPLEGSATLAVALVESSDAPWAENALATFGPFSGTDAWGFTLPADIGAGSYDLLLVTSDGKATALPMTVHETSPWALVAAIGIGVFSITAVSLRRHRRAHLPR